MPQRNKLDKVYLSQAEGSAAPPWNAPLPLNGAPEVPEFPLNSLPEPLRSMVYEVAESVRLPMDAPAMAAITVASVCGLGKYEYLVEDHIEYPPIWTCSLLASGERKTAAFRPFFAALYEWQAVQRSCLKAEIDVAKQRYELEDQQIQSLKLQAAKASAQERREKVLEDLDEIVRNRTVVPQSADIIVQDITPEGAAAFLSVHRGRGCVLSDEGGLFNTIGGRYSGIPNIDALNKSHSGSTIVVHRSQREALEIASPHLSVGLSVQPEVLRNVAESQFLRGTGFFGRFLFVLPKGMVGQRLHNPRPIEPKVQKRFIDAIHAALGQAPVHHDPLLRQIILDSDSYHVWRKFHDETEVSLGAGRHLSLIADWGNKLAGNAARIAGAFHLVRCGSNDPTKTPICPDDMISAVAIGDYLREHALAAFGLIGLDDRCVLANKIVNWIKANSKSQFRLAEVNAMFRSEDKRTVSAAIGLLVEHGHIRDLPNEVRQEKRGRKPYPSFEVNPMCLDSHGAAINTVNTVYSKGDSANRVPGQDDDTSSGSEAERRLRLKL